LFGRALIRRTLRNSERRLGTSGQSIAEFAVVAPVVLLLLVSIADLGRLYTSAVAVESAAREAADFGSFQTVNWTAVNIPTTLAAMEHRACTAAAGSHLQDYESTDPDNKTCTNPSFECELEWNGAGTDCGSSGGFTNGHDCSDVATEPPCTVHVTMTYDFRLILAIPPLPASIQLERHSRYRISELTPP
jgi:Flp pilus assembly protein TadG